MKNYPGIHIIVQLENRLNNFLQSLDHETTELVMAAWHKLCGSKSHPTTGAALATAQLRRAGFLDSSGNAHGGDLLRTWTPDGGEQIIVQHEEQRPTPVETAEPESVSVEIAEDGAKEEGDEHADHALSNVE